MSEVFLFLIYRIYPIDAGGGSANAPGAMRNVTIRAFHKPTRGFSRTKPVGATRFRSSTNMSGILLPRGLKHFVGALPRKTTA
jgi:hypothetical protein